MSIRVNPLGLAAAEIFGLDCSGPLTDQAFQVVESAFLDYPYYFFAPRFCPPPMWPGLETVRSARRISHPGNHRGE
jgi:hypothetical protein